MVEHLIFIHKNSSSGDVLLLLKIVSISNKRKHLPASLSALSAPIVLDNFSRTSVFKKDP